MSYQVLARKWRPRSFKDMVGQEPVLRMLSNALEQKRLHHAYLLTGTRGVGKTTLARILAKCLNCEAGVSATPCEQCHACKAISDGKFLDLYEIDAASRTKVEDTRELLDSVPYPPTQGRYKVYLIDEVHMLSSHSFNALLKTLEEPPEQVIFMLATTDIKRLPITILSRCLLFHLKRITPEQIAGHLHHICDAEKVTHDQAALETLAKAADGSMRDALSLLDQAIAYGHGSVHTPDMLALLGSMAPDDLLPLLQALASQNGPQLFRALNELTEHAPDFKQALEELIHLLHQLAIAQIVPGAMVLNDKLKPFISQFSAEELQLYYQIALLGRRDLSLSPSPQQGFEMTLVRMLAFKPVHTGRTETAAAPSHSEPGTLTAPRAQRAWTTVTPVHSPAPATAANWPDMLPKLGLSGMAYALAENCSLTHLTAQKMELTLSAKHEPMLNPKLKDRLNEAINQHLQRTVQLIIHVTTNELETPARQQQTAQKQALAGATDTLMQDPRIKQLVEMYDATVEVSLIS